MPDPPQQAGEQVERLRIVVCPVCRHAEEVATFNNGVVCHGFEKRGTAHARTFMRPYVPADQATQQLRECERNAARFHDRLVEVEQQLREAEGERDKFDRRWQQAMDRLDEKDGLLALHRAEAAEKALAELRERVEAFVESLRKQFPKDVALAEQLAAPSDTDHPGGGEAG